MCARIYLYTRCPTVEASDAIISQTPNYRYSVF